MKKMIWLTTISILFMLFVVPGILSLAIKMIPANDQPGYDYNRRLAIYAKREISQEFVSRENNLTAIATSIRNPNLKNKKEVILKLFDNNKNLIRTSVLNGLNIEDGDFVRFVFPVIPDSKGKPYFFTLASPEAGEGETIEVFIIDKPTAGITQYAYGDQIYPGGIPMVTFHEPQGRLEVLKKVYSNWFSRLLFPNSQKIN
jgi:hypothetical protein